MSDEVQAETIFSFLCLILINFKHVWLTSGVTHQDLNPGLSRRTMKGIYRILSPLLQNGG